MPRGAGKLIAKIAAVYAFHGNYHERIREYSRRLITYSFGPPLDPGVMIPQYAFLEPQISNIFKRSAITELSTSPTLGFNATETMTISGMYAKLKVRSLAKYLFSQLLRDRRLKMPSNLTRTYTQRPMTLRSMIHTGGHNTERSWKERLWQAPL